MPLRFLADVITLISVYNGLPHPPATYLGPRYARRSADGSDNNLSDPDLGRAGTPYARSVQQSHPLPRDSLPNAGLVFDTLLKRDYVSYMRLFGLVLSDIQCLPVRQAPCWSFQYDV